MLINFIKMHSLGNDFIVIDAISQSLKLRKEQIIQLADRHFGVGCDQVLLIEPPFLAESDFFFRIFNADGSEAEQCGNGIRCVAKAVVDLGLVTKNKMIADSLSGLINIEIRADQTIVVNWREMPVDISAQQITIPSIPINLIYSISMGNPHGICLLSREVDLANIPLKNWGEKLSVLPFFPAGANISFVQILAADEINLVVYERGVGPSLACGSAACAAFATVRNLAEVSQQPDKIKINFLHGSLQVWLEQSTRQLYLSGPIQRVFLGIFCL